MKKIILAVSALLMFSCSSDDSTNEEPIVENPIECSCVKTTYQVHTTPSGVPIDTTLVSVSPLDYKQECGYNENATLVNTVTNYGYLYENVTCEN